MFWLLLQRDENDWVSNAIKILALLFFIGLPILRSIREAIAKRAQSEGPDKQREAAERAREGKRAWEELMRGSRAEPEAPAEAARPSAPTVSVPPVPAAQPSPRAGSGPPPIPTSERVLVEELRSSPRLAPSDGERAAPDEEELATQEIARREGEGLEHEIERSRDREELGASWDKAREALSGAAMGGALPGRETRDLERQPAERASRPTRRASRASWRRAIVLNEVLSAPVSERAPADRSLPAAYRT